MEVKAIHRNARISASKGRDLARAVQGKRLGDALRIVDFSPRKAAKILGAARLSRPPESIGEENARALY